MKKLILKDNIDFRNFKYYFVYCIFSNFIIKFLRTDGILSITTVTMDNLIKTTVICFGLLGVILITSLILRIIFMKIDNTDESKLIASRTIVACLVFMIILF